MRGITIDAKSPIADDPEAVRRSECTTSLIHWASMNGLVSRNSIKLVINERGHVVLKAQQFIPANKHLLHVPFKLDLSFNTLKYEVDEDKNWPGWQDLRARIKAFEQSFQWSPHNYDQKDNFSKNLILVTCIMGVLKKIADTDPDHFDRVSDTLKTFSYYWDALPSAIGSVLCDWSDFELALLRNTSFFSCLPDAKRFGYEMFNEVFLPFIAQHPDKFITDIDFEIFMKVNSIVCTRSFAHRYTHLAPPTLTHFIFSILSLCTSSLQCSNSDLLMMIIIIIVLITVIVIVIFILYVGGVGKTSPRCCR